MVIPDVNIHISIRCCCFFLMTTFANWHPFLLRAQSALVRSSLLWVIYSHRNGAVPAITGHEKLMGFTAFILRFPNKTTVIKNRKLRPDKKDVCLVTNGELLWGGPAEIKGPRCAHLGSWEADRAALSMALGTHSGGRNSTGKMRSSREWWKGQRANRNGHLRCCSEWKNSSQSDTRGE